MEELVGGTQQNVPTPSSATEHETLAALLRQQHMLISELREQNSSLRANAVDADSIKAGVLQALKQELGLKQHRVPRRRASDTAEEHTAKTTATLGAWNDTAQCQATLLRSDASCRTTWQAATARRRPRTELGRSSANPILDNRARAALNREAAAQATRERVRNFLAKSPLQSQHKSLQALKSNSDKCWGAQGLTGQPTVHYKEVKSFLSLYIKFEVSYYLSMLHAIALCSMQSIH
jgi:hypothetical protein